MAEAKGKISEKMVWKLEKWCKDIIDKMENGEIGNYQMVVICHVFAITNNSVYRRKALDVWPTYLQDLEAMEYYHPDVLCDQLDSLNLPKD